LSLTTKVLLNKTYQKKDKAFPLVIRVTYNRKIIYIPLGYSLNEKDFDDRNQRIKGASKITNNVTLLNNKIAAQVKNIFDVITRLEQDNLIQGMSMTDIKKAILNDQSDRQQTLFIYYQKLITDLRNTGKYGNAIIYGDSLKAWQKFRQNKDLSFSQITFRTLKSFENFFLARGVKPNTISVYLRTFRAVFNRAIKEGLAKREHYPFDQYQIPSNKTKKGAVTLDIVSSIENYRAKESTAIWHAKNFFLFSFYCRGINFVDMAYLKIGSIVDGRLNYIRRKTGTDFSIKIHDKAQKIIALYAKGKAQDDYLFPIVSSVGNQERIFLQVKNKLQNYNKLLKKISNDLGLNAPLTTYTARHSYATGLKIKGISSEIIKESLGHTNVSVTETYLKSFENVVIDDADNALFGEL